MNWLRNIWNAQHNAEQVAEQDGLIETQRSLMASQHIRLIELIREADRLAFDRKAYSSLTATLAAEYRNCLGVITDIRSLPDSIKEAHMLRGVATNWVNADDVRIGKPMWEKRQRAKKNMDNLERVAAGVMSGEIEPGSQPWGNFGLQMALMERASRAGQLPPKTQQSVLDGKL